MPEMFLTVEQAAERLQLHPATIRRQLRTGALRGVRRGRVYRIPESALSQNSPSPSSQAQAGLDADALWAQMTTGGAQGHNQALRALAQASEEVRTEIMRRSGEVAAKYYATPKGQAELADWRALDGEPFHDDAGDYYSPEEEAQFRAQQEAKSR